MVPARFESPSPVIAALLREAATLVDVKSATRLLRAGQDIISESERCSSLFILAEGIGITYRILHNGQRQILDLHIPGDFCGVPACFLPTSLYATRMVTPAAVVPIPMARLISLFDKRPQLALKWMAALACHTAIYAERVSAACQLSAEQRVAHLLTELFTRFRRIGLADDNSFSLPLTQVLLSDTLGLSIPYLNRVLHGLRDAGLVSIDRQQVQIPNPEELRLFCGFNADYLTPPSLTDFDE